MKGLTGHQVPELGFRVELSDEIIDLVDCFFF